MPTAMTTTNNLEIFGTKGKIQVDQPWFPNYESIITQTVNNITDTVSIKTNLNIYTHQLNTISDFIIRGKDKNYSIIKQDEMIDNMSILDKWKKLSKKDYDSLDYEEVSFTWGEYEKKNIDHIKNPNDYDLTYWGGKCMSCGASN